MYNPLNRKTLTRTKSLVREKLPWLARVYGPLAGYIERRHLTGLSMDEVFSEIHRTDKWGREVAPVSGTGSDAQQTAALRSALPDIIQEYEIRSLLDIPCGDYHWMQQVELKIERYIGADIVDKLVTQNKQAFAGNKSREFARLDIAKDELPETDLIFCRDCLVHFSYRDIFRSLANIKKSGSRYLMTTTFCGKAENVEIATGQWRPLNLECGPFNFPPPLKLIRENCTEGQGVFSDKCMGLWAVADIPDA